VTETLGPAEVSRSTLTAPQIETTSRTNLRRLDNLLPGLSEACPLLPSLLHRQIPLPLPARRPLPVGHVPLKFGMTFTTFSY
jgi:hypothetical protein